MDSGQMAPLGYPNLICTLKIYVPWIPDLQIDRQTSREIIPGGAGLPHLQCVGWRTFYSAVLKGSSSLHSLGVVQEFGW
jgi:hypothetical protein